jgi:hypothetical protein
MLSPPTKSLILAYIPVIHQGYILWLKEHPEVEIWVMGQSLTAKFRPLQKDIRALAPDQIVVSLKALKLGSSAKVIEADESKLVGPDTVIFLPDEQVSHAIAEEFLIGRKLKFEPIFLRWDGAKAVQPQLVAAANATDFMALATNIAGKSADWWRQVGAVVVREGKVLLTAYNQHLPSDQQPYIDGDPRADFHRGTF